MEVREPSAKYLSRPSRLLTSAGELPADWIVQPLGELMRLLNGRAFRPDEWSDTGAPIIRIQNLNDPESDFNFFAGVVDERNVVRPGDLLFAWSGTTGSSFGARVWTGPEGVLNQHIFKVLPDLRKLSSAFAYRLLLKAQYSIERQAHGFKASFVHVKKSDLVSVSAGYPPTLEEQDRVVEALDNVDALIESLEQLLTKKRQIKQGAMQELLTGKRRLPGFGGEWVTCELRQLGHVVRGVAYNPGTDLADGDTEQTVRLLRSNNVQGGEIVRSGLQFVDRRRVRNDQYLQDGDLLLCMANGSRDLVGKTGRFERADEHPYTFGAFMACYRPDSTSVAPEFVAFLFQTHAFRQHVDLLLAGSSINNLRPEGVLGFTTSIPSEHSEQVAIAQALFDMGAEITALESRLTKARALKQAMAQALLTGRIRLPVDTMEPTP